MTGAPATQPAEAPKPTAPPAAAPSAEPAPVKAESSSAPKAESSAPKAESSAPKAAAESAKPPAGASAAAKVAEAKVEPPRRPLPLGPRVAAFSMGVAVAMAAYYQLHQELWGERAQVAKAFMRRAGVEQEKKKEPKESGLMEEDLRRRVVRAWNGGVDAGLAWVLDLPDRVSAFYNGRPRPAKN